VKAIFLALLMIPACLVVRAQSVGINADKSQPNASALDVKSFTKGMLLPRTSTTSRLAIVNPAKGLILYDTTTSGFLVSQRICLDTVFTRKQQLGQLICPTR